MEIGLWRRYNPASWQTIEGCRFAVNAGDQSGESGTEWYQKRNPRTCWKRSESSRSVFATSMPSTTTAGARTIFVVRFFFRVEGSKEEGEDIMVTYLCHTQLFKDSCAAREGRSNSFSKYTSISFGTSKFTPQTLYYD